MKSLFFILITMFVLVSCTKNDVQPEQHCTLVQTIVLDYQSNGEVSATSDTEDCVWMTEEEISAMNYKNQKPDWRSPGIVQKAYPNEDCSCE